LADDDHREAIKSAHYRQIDIHGIDEGEVPGFTSDHLEDSEDGPAEMIEMGDAKVDIGTLVDAI
jgi:hypothetical protein